MVLPGAFHSDFVKDVTIAGSAHFIRLSRIDIGALQSYFTSWTCVNKSDWDRVFVLTVEVLVVKDNCCEEKDIRVLDLSGYVKLRELKVGDYCFRKVEELKLIGMECLERVVIGQNSFAKYPYNISVGRDDKRHFYLKNCPKLKSLKMGRFSFSDYSVCEIESVDALEVIEMGELNEWSCNFYYASLELKSILIHNE